MKTRICDVCAKPVGYPSYHWYKEGRLRCMDMCKRCYEKLEALATGRTPEAPRCYLHHADKELVCRQCTHESAVAFRSSSV